MILEIVLGLIYTTGFILHFRWHVHYHAREYGKYLRWGNSETIITTLFSLLWPMMYFICVVPEWEIWKDKELNEHSPIRNWHDRLVKKYWNL